eukprot:6203180-Pleurochrysis_carterae.AAC.3
MASVDLNKVAPFLIKLFEIVSSPASDGLICWSEYGESFKIIDRTKFAQVGARFTFWLDHTCICSTSVLRSCTSQVCSNVIDGVVCRMCCPCTSSTTTCGPLSDN